MMQQYKSFASEESGCVAGGGAGGGVTEYLAATPCRPLKPFPVSSSVFLYWLLATCRVNNPGTHPDWFLGGGSLNVNADWSL